MIKPEMDYYGVLEVKRSATQEEITLAYRKLAIRLCPDMDPNNLNKFSKIDPKTTHMTPMVLHHQWEYLHLAYDVLRNPLSRMVYDRYGEGGLLQGVHLPNGYFPPYTYDGNHMKIYKEVFASYSPYASLIDGATNPPPLYSSCYKGIGVRVQDPPIEKRFYVELREVRYGTVKMMHVWRQDFTDHTKTATEKKKTILRLKIKPGITPGTRFCFQKEGDRSVNRIPADIIFIANDKPHPSLKRRNLHDLVYKHKIDLCQALSGFRFVIETLDKRRLHVSISDVVSPGYTKVIPYEGLPKCSKNDLPPNQDTTVPPEQSNFGSMIVEFEVIFPIVETQQMKTLTREFFRSLKILENELGLPKEQQPKKIAEKPEIKSDRSDPFDVFEATDKNRHPND